MQQSSFLRTTSIPKVVSICSWNTLSLKKMTLWQKGYNPNCMLVM